LPKPVITKAVILKPVILKPVIPKAVITEHVIKKNAADLGAAPRRGIFHLLLYKRFYNRYKPNLIIVLALFVGLLGDHPGFVEAKKEGVDDLGIEVRA
jgi:hypothetical protein